MITDMNYIIAALLLLLPSVTFAQSVQGMITGLGDLVNNYLIPFVLALAFFIFVYNAFRFFILEGSNEDGRENAKNLAIYSVMAFTFFVLFWGLINFFSEEIGLDNEPCSNDTVSDYVISNLAPCTSPRPRPRPPVTDTTAPVLGGSGNNTDSPIIIPGNGGAQPITPTTPGLPAPGGTASYAAVQAAQTSIRTTAAPFFTTQFNTDFGYNRDIVAPLFTDLGSTYSNSVTELNRLRAAVRLNELGVISDTQVTTYLNAYNTYATAAGTLSSGPITLANIQSSLSTNPPAALQSRENQTRQLLIDTLTLYNMNSSTDVDITAAIANAYSATSDTNTRYEMMLEIFYPPAAPGGGSATQLPINTQAKNAFIEQFVSDINTEKIYAGDFDLVE